MTDDLVKRLRSLGRTGPGRISFLASEDAMKAASRIEKLEMLLHGEKCLRQDLEDTAEAHSKQQLDRIKKLEAALIDILKVLRSEASWGIALVIARHALEGKDD